MPISKDQLGVRTEDGRTRAPVQSVLSGRLLSPGDVFLNFPGKSFFVGVTAEEWRGLTVGERRALKDEWRRELPTDQPVVEEAVQSRGEQLYESMSLADLKKEATARKLDMSGRRSKAEHVSALIAADIRERFAGTTATPAAPESGDVEGAAEAVPGTTVQPAPAPRGGSREG